MPPLSGKAKHSMPLNVASYFTTKAAKCKASAVAPILRLFSAQKALRIAARCGIINLAFRPLSGGHC